MADANTAAWDAQWSQLHPNEGPRPEGYHGESVGGSSGGGNTSSAISTAEEIMKLQQRANQPAVQALQSSIPTTEATFAQRQQQLEGEKAPLQQRYKNLLDEITRRQGVEESRAGIAQSRELGRRGISSESGYYDQSINETLSPISQFYTGQFKETGLAGEDALRQLQNQISGIPLEKQASLDAINQAIAQLQSGAASTGIGQGLSLFQSNQQAQQQAAQLALQQQIAQREAGLQDFQMGVQQQRNPLELALLQAQVSKANQPSAADLPPLDSLYSQFGG